MDVSGSRELDDLCNKKQAEVRACLNGCVDESNGDDTNTSNAEEMPKQGRKSKSRRKCLAKSASFPSAVPPSEDDDDEIVVAMRRMFSDDSVQSTYSRSISLPTPLELVSALKGSREKQGLPPKKLTVKWAPDVYDPLPTSVLHTVRNKKQPNSKKNNDKKKNGKKWKKSNNSGRGNGGKDNKQSRRGGGGGGSSDRCYKPPPEFHQDSLASSSSVDLDGFNVGSPDPSYCGTSFLKKSPTSMHYSVAEAL